MFIALPEVFDRDSHDELRVVAHGSPAPERSETVASPGLVA
jgi:hypothetical protein